MAKKIKCNNLSCLNNTGYNCSLESIIINVKGKCKDIVHSQNKCLTCEHNIHYSYTEDDGSVWEANDCKKFVIFKSMCNAYVPVGGINETDND